MTKLTDEIVDEICSDIESFFCDRNTSFRKQGFSKDEMLNILACDSEALKKIRISESFRNMALFKKCVCSHSNDSRQLLKRYEKADIDLDKEIATAAESMASMKPVSAAKSLLQTESEAKPVRKLKR